MLRQVERSPIPRRRLIAAALLISTILAGGVAAHAWSQPASVPSVAASSTAMAPYGLPQLGFADLVDKVKPAVVNIATTEKTKRPDAQQMPNLPPEMQEMLRRYFRGQKAPQSEEGAARHSAGSGFLIDADGYIVTNNHVVDGATKIEVTLDDGTTYSATVKGRDEKVDLALLKIDAGRPLPFLAWGNSEAARVGDWVIAVGNAFGLGGTVTAGIVSAHNRNIHAGPYDDFLQIDAPINPGNSGGPLFNQQGQVIGVDTAIYSPSGGSVGIGFAIPSNLAAKVVAQLREHGTVERGWLGVQMQPLTPSLAKAIGRSGDDGVLINRVEDDSPASRARLQQGDVITAFNGKAIRSPRDLAVAVADSKAGTAVPVTVWRNGKERTVDVAIARPASAEKVAAAETGGRAPVGLALSQLSNEQREELGLPTSTKGVVVARVTPDSRAAESGIEAGDVIVRVGDDQVATPADAVARIRAAEDAKKEAIPLLVMREGTTYYLALQLRRS